MSNLAPNAFSGVIPILATPFHPDESPEIVGMLDYLIDPPSRLASTSRWLRFRDNMAQAVADRPHDPHFPLFLAQAEKILAYRATIAPERRIWKADA